MDDKIDPDLFVRCRLSKICLKLFESAQYCKHVYLCVLQKLVICVLFCDSA